MAWRLSEESPKNEVQTVLALEVDDHAVLLLLGGERDPIRRRSVGSCWG